MLQWFYKQKTIFWFNQKKTDDVTVFDDPKLCILGESLSVNWQLIPSKGWFLENSSYWQAWEISWCNEWAILQYEGSIFQQLFTKMQSLCCLIFLRFILFQNLISLLCWGMFIYLLYRYIQITLQNVKYYSWRFTAETSKLMDVNGMALLRISR